jgi:hypothetical protein
MWRRDRRIHIRRQIKSRRSTSLVRQYVGANRNLRLSPDPFRQRDTAKRKSAVDRLAHARVFDQLELQQLGHSLPRHIVGGRSETAGDENDFCAWKNIPECDGNGNSIGNGALFVDPQAEFKNLTGDEGEVRIDDVTQQDLGAGVDHNSAHYMRTMR